MKRTFIYSDDKSDKFWSIATDENSFTVVYGKQGTAGQRQTKTFADEDACLKEVEKLIREKTKKGYVEDLLSHDDSTGAVAIKNEAKVEPENKPAAKSASSKSKSVAKHAGEVEKLDLDLFPKAVSAMIVDSAGQSFNFISCEGYSPARMRVDSRGKKQMTFYKWFDDKRLQTVEVLKFIAREIRENSYGIQYLNFILDSGEGHDVDTKEFNALMERIDRSEYAEIIYDPMNTASRRKVAEACMHGDYAAFDKFVAAGLDVSKGMIDEGKYRFSPLFFAEDEGKNKEMTAYIKELQAAQAVRIAEVEAETKVREKLHDDYIARIREEDEHEAKRKKEEAEKKIVQGGALKKVAEWTIMGSEQGHEPITLLWDNVIGIIGGREYSDGLDVIDFLTGKTLWKAESVETYNNNTCPVFDGKYVYVAIDGNSGTYGISARDAFTGEEAWYCSLSNSDSQFGTPMVMTPRHIAVANTDNQKLTIIDKQGGKKGEGKVTSRAKAKHAIREDFGELMAWGDKFIALGLSDDEQEILVDLYNPALAEPFVETLLTLADECDPLKHLLVGDELYIAAFAGYFYRINLAERTCVRVGHPHESRWTERDPDKAIDNYQYSDMDLHEGKLYYTAIQNGDEREQYVCVYDIATGHFEAIPVSEPEADFRSIVGGGRVLTKDDVKITLYNPFTRKSVAYINPEMKDVEWGDWENWLITDRYLVGTTRIGKRNRETGNSLLRVWEL